MDPKSPCLPQALLPGDLGWIHNGSAAFKIAIASALHHNGVENSQSDFQEALVPTVDCSHDVEHHGSCQPETAQGEPVEFDLPVLLVRRRHVEHRSSRGA